MRAVVLIWALLCTAAQAGVKVVGNGGTGLVVDGKLYLLDLVEAGVHKSPHLSSQNTLPLFRERVAKSLKNLPEAPAPAVAGKLSEIYRQDPILALLMLKTMELYSWRAVDMELAPIEVDEQLMSYPKDSLRHLATRYQQLVLVQKSHWASLDEANRAALLFHEMLFALLPPEDDPLGPGQRQSGLKARLATGELFLSGGYRPERARGVLDFLPETPAPNQLRTAESAAALAFVQAGRLLVVNAWGDLLEIEAAQHSPGEIAAKWSELFVAGGDPDRRVNPWIGAVGGEYSASVKKYRNRFGSETTHVAWIHRRSDSERRLRFLRAFPEPGDSDPDPLRSPEYWELSDFRRIVERALPALRKNPFAAGMQVLGR